jgi:tetratricopeptide (TPR) repeat protein
MLFDLRGAGRRTFIKGVYLTLAILMGGGLVLFGIGGDVSGGLVDAITERGASTGSTDDRYRERVQEAQRATQANPQNAGAWAELARARFQLATIGDSFDQQTLQFTDEGKRQLAAAAEAWERHLALDPEQADDGVASLMVEAYSQTGLNEPEKAVRAQEVITEVRPQAETFATLAALAYQAGQTRKGDLARAEAIDRADEDERETIKSQLDQAKQQALTQQVQDATQNAPTPEAGGGQDSGGGGSGGSNRNRNGGGGSGSNRNRDNDGG